MMLSDVDKVAYLRACTDDHGAFRVFLSGPTVGAFTNPRPLGVCTHT